MARPKSPNAQLPRFGKGKEDPDKVPALPRSPAPGSGYPRRTELWWPCEAGHVIRLDWIPTLPLAPHDTCPVSQPDPCGAELHGPYASKPEALEDPVIKIARSQLTRKKAS